MFLSPRIKHQVYFKQPVAPPKPHGDVEYPYCRVPYDYDLKPAFLAFWLDIQQRYPRPQVLFERTTFQELQIEWNKDLKRFQKFQNRIFRQDLEHFEDQARSRLAFIETELQKWRLDFINIERGIAIRDELLQHNETLLKAMGLSLSELEHTLQYALDRFDLITDYLEDFKTKGWQIEAILGPYETLTQTLAHIQDHMDGY